MGAEAAKITASTLDNCELLIEALKRQLVEHEAEQKRLIIAKEFAKAGELEEKMKAIQVEILIQKERKSKAEAAKITASTLDNCELLIEALKRQLVEHEAKQKRHILAKEF